jgi:hypothetical protein
MGAFTDVCKMSTNLLLDLANGFGWKRFVKMVDQVMPRRGTTLDIPFPEDSEDDD